MKELIFMKDAIIERTKVVSSITNKESWHEERIPYSAIKNFDIIGIVKIEPTEKEDGFAIKIVATAFNIHKSDEAIPAGRKETRRMRIARVLMQHVGKPLTVKDLRSNLDKRDDDLANLQWEAKLLTNEDKRFVETSKDGRKAYMYRGDSAN